MTYVLGLTGSIGMGKSTTAQMFRDLGVPVWDADAAVHRLYAKGGAAVARIAALAPQAILGDAVDRARLRDAIAADPALLDRINAAVHPLVAADRAAFLAATRAAIVVMDVPLLFETGGEGYCDGVAVVSAPPEVQRARVLARGMPERDLDLILSRQMPDAQKRARADFVIPTSTLDGARTAVQDILEQLRGGDA